MCQNVPKYAKICQILKKDVKAHKRSNLVKIATKCEKRDKERQKYTKIWVQKY